VNVVLHRKVFKQFTMDSTVILELLYEDDVDFVDKIPMQPVGNTVSITNVVAYCCASNK